MTAEQMPACPAAVSVTDSPDRLPGRRFLIRVVRSGCGAALNGEKVFLLRPGCVLMLRPEENLSFHLLSPVRCLDFYLNEDAAGLLQDGMEFFTSPPGLRILPEETLREAEQLAQESLEIRRQQRSGSSLAVLENFLAAARLVLRSGAEPSGIEPKIALTLMFMEENYSRDITLNDLAGLIGVSISHYRRSFRRVLGFSPIDFLLDLRLRHAEKLLAETGLSVAGTASETGFGDANYFSRIFSRRKGVSPRKWRQTRRENPN